MPHIHHGLTLSSHALPSSPYLCPCALRTAVQLLRSVAHITRHACPADRTAHVPSRRLQDQHQLSALQIAKQMRGEEAFPWEGPALPAPLQHRLGALEGPVLAMLARQPEARPPVAAFRDAARAVAADAAPPSAQSSAQELPKL